MRIRLVMVTLLLIMILFMVAPDLALAQEGDDDDDGRGRRGRRGREIPEAPVTALLLVAGTATVGGYYLVKRRRAGELEG